MKKDVTKIREKYLKLPCGCESWVEDNAFIMIPHSLECKFYLYALEETRKHGKCLIINSDPDLRKKLLGNPSKTCFSNK